MRGIEANTMQHMGVPAPSLRVDQDLPRQPLSRVCGSMVFTACGEVADDDTGLLVKRSPPG